MPTTRRRTASSNPSPTKQEQPANPNHNNEQEVEHKVHGTIFGIDRNVFYAASFTEEDDEEEHVNFMLPRNAPRRAPLQLAHADNVNSDVDLLGLHAHQMSGDATDDSCSTSSTTTHRGSVHSSTPCYSETGPFRTIQTTSMNHPNHTNHARTTSSTINELDIFTVPSVSSGSMKNVVEVEPSYISTKFLLPSSTPELWNSAQPAMRRRRYIQLWLCLFSALLSLFVCIAVTASSASSGYNQQQQQEQQSQKNSMPISSLQSAQQENNTDNNNNSHRTLQTLTLEEQFADWANRHRRRYSSEAERMTRFQIWSDNHARTISKNLKHGPCKFLKKNVFGDTHFKDLSPKEFQQRFLTGYKGPKSTLMDPKAPTAKTSRGNKMTHEYMKQYKNPLHVPRHASLQTAYRNHWMKHTNAIQSSSSAKLTEEESSSSPSWFMSLTSALVSAIFEADMSYSNGNNNNGNEAANTSYPSSCTWWNLVCLLRWLFGSTFLGSGTREPKYDANNYPSAIDWRDMGAVTSIHSQGDCGACWAITAVETIESAYYVKTGQLVDLAETEVIACDDSCQQCDGGWPQNAYDYVQENNGLPLESDMSYDGSWLLELTAYLQGESDAYSQNDIDAYMSNTCPANSNNNNNNSGGSGSNDNNNNDDGNTSRARYGAIQGYGYATERCYCYTDGSGCDCDDQKENQAVRNIASYGPATVCVDASLWQDYTGGIITSESGCSMGFMDMNHCVQAVGYAYVSGNGDDGDDNNSNSGSGSGSGDDEQRQGYWIIRNQWDTNWGMNGYAWVAMGENTCGVLNDMTQAFMD